MMNIEKVDFCGSVTCVCYGTYLNTSLIIWSSGGVVHCFERQSHKQNSMRVFEYNYIHGIKSYPQFNLLLVYGNKSLAILRLERNSASNVELSFNLLYKTDQLDDMILDAFILNESIYGSISYISILAGFAHNFFDEISLKLCQGELGSKWEILQRCQCPDISVLFALTLSVNPFDRDDVIVASGNVFGKLTLWKRDVLQVRTEAPQAGKILTSIHLHEGVVFRVVWKLNANDKTRGNKILTVSDDRTVRMWQVDSPSEQSDTWRLSQLFVGWGHISRVWDTIFLDMMRIPAGECEIATCSEDGTIKFWASNGQCTATLQGHCGSVWSIATIPCDDRLGNKPLIVSGGNDGSVKFWDIDYHRHNSPKEELGTMTNILIPDWPQNNEFPEIITEIKIVVDNLDPEIEKGSTEHEEVVGKKITKKKSNSSTNSSNRRKNGVNMLRISPCGNYIIVVMIDGKLWYVSIQPNELASQRPNELMAGGFVFDCWIPIVDLQKIIVEADIKFCEDVSDGEYLIVAASSVDGSAFCFNVYLPSIIHGLRTTAEIVQSCVWKPHPMKTVNIWFPIIYSAPQLEEDDRRKSTIVTATLQGLGTLWTWNGEDRMEKIFSFVTGRKEIASSCLIYRHTTKISFLVIGDSRGGVNIYCIPSIPVRDNDESVLYPTQFFPFIHKSDPVSALTACFDHSTGKCGLYCAGHDNFLSYFQLQNTGIDADGQEHHIWTFENIVTTTPVQTPDQIIVTRSNISSNNTRYEANRSIFLTGYYGNSFSVYDVRRSMQLMKIEGGGWKRPHHSQLIFQTRGKVNIDELPTVIFACPAPVGKKETELQLFGYKAPVSQSSVCDGSAAKLWPLQLGTPSFSNVSNCSVIVNIPGITRFTVVGGEDCMMRVYSLDACTSLSRSISPSMLLMETTLSKNSSIKSLSTAANRGDPRKGIVVGAGGKLLFYIWAYDYSSMSSPRQEFVDLSPLRKVYTGTILNNASQDHRILSVRALFINQEYRDDANNQLVLFDHFLIVLADSRGFITIVHFLYNFSKMNENQLDHQVQSCQYQLQILYQAEVSSCPLLGIDIRFTDSDQNFGNKDLFVLVAAGDTKGSLIYALVPLQLNQYCSSRCR